MPGNMRSSMQKDVEQGNPPELDAIAGPDPARARTARHRSAGDEELVADVERSASRPHIRILASTD